MITETIFLGILLGFIYYELVGITPGGIVAPGYIALYFHKPTILITTLLVVIITYVIVKGLSHLIILYGRRAFLCSVIIGFLLKWVIETYVLQISGFANDLRVIGYIIPGLIANEMRKQGVEFTIVSLIIVSGLVHFIILIQRSFFP